ncbi:MAG TPA: OB-fold nucleic acid binding domain-containing protein [Candidatus Woesearchaeota archaeon]|nr:OB-fold nucleic acid binding domain-containing protein [Candidatus Woesearchaeota archaeon]
MFNIPYDELVKKISEKSEKSKDEVEKLIKTKIQELSGLLTKEGAAHIIANELGLTLVDSIEGRLKIEAIVEGLRGIETIGRISRIFDTNSFSRKDGSPGKVRSFILADKNSSIRVVMWNEIVDKYPQLKDGDIIVVENALVKKNNTGSLELHLNSQSKLIINPEGEGEEIPISQAGPKKRVMISELKGSEGTVEIFGTIVNVFDIRFYEVCPECQKRSKKIGESFICQTHGEITPSFNYVLNAVLDDGSSTIRAVFFTKETQLLCGLTDEELLKYNGNATEFEKVKHELLGKQVIITGNVVNNELFSRIEIVAREVNPNPDPQEEIKKL